MIINKVRIIYLDIDGVITNLRTHLGISGRGGLYTAPDPVAVAAINRVCESVNDVHIVISSSWARGVDHCNINHDGSTSKIAKLLIDTGFNRFIFAKEWKIQHTDNRKFDIIEHSKRHSEIYDFIVIDDDPYSKVDNHIFIQTNPLNGMSSDNIIQLYNWASIP